MTSKIFLLIMLAIWAACSKTEQTPETIDFKAQVEQLANNKLPEVKWYDDSLMTADLNDDRVEDYAISGQVANRFYIAVIFGPLSKQSKIATLDFGIGGSGQDDLCEGDNKLALESLDYNSNEMLGAKLPGFKRSQTSQGLAIGGDMCDKFHVYWNHAENKFGWWRL